MNLIPKIKYRLDWLCKDLRVRNGAWVLGEPANKSLIIFTVSAILTVVTYHSFWQKLFGVVAVAALLYWSIAEIRTGHSRFRKLLGLMALAALIVLVAIYKSF